ncbi:hypothetical protein E2C01_099003 [Portunus trituberculatus]|uniref:Uncharacterized protein n=1 Tax=Portunus trituberculatus TaxID=210409 RepID=A0A5B7K9U7_PORTR|nr:hypothetical protein [Portunus trituberculatus]
MEFQGHDISREVRVANIVAETQLRDASPPPPQLPPPPEFPVSVIAYFFYLYCEAVDTEGVEIANVYRPR